MPVPILIEEQLNVSADPMGNLPAQRNQLIAICGIGCRLPGGADSSPRFWQMLAQSKSGQCDLPHDRFNVDAFYHPRGLDRPGSMNTRGGYFLQDQDVRDFDNDFFGINNLEATYMDPQQRKLLEVAFESMEDAGVTLEAASGSNTGCYVANFTMDFQIMQGRDSEYFNRYSATGMGTTILSNRISHAFNLMGPSFVLDTACSSSLYCLHLACVALENDECDAAIVAGVNLVLSPEQHLGTMKTGVLSPSSTCHTFDISADGYGRADGVGALYLKRLDDALCDGDPVRSVIRGSAINANGRTAGISLPVVDGQAAVIHKAYAKAGLDPTATTYVECHGTGTAVGDVIEVESLSHVFKRPETSPLLIGSAKTNVGHSEAASGITSVIKCTLALEHGEIPGTVGLQQRNPKLAFPGIDIPVVLTPWPAVDVRRASVNSFGYGGANAHLILEDATRHLPQDYGKAALRSSTAGGPHRLVLLPISAADNVSLEARSHALKDHNFDGVHIADLAYTMGCRRSHMSHRGFFLPGRDDSLVRSIANTSLQTIPTDSNDPQPISFIFTGQGAQWDGMGKELFEEFPVFRHAILELDEVLHRLPHPPSWTIQAALLNDDSQAGSIHDPIMSQPLCTAMQVALVQLLGSWNLYPESTVGHSSGEIGAAFAAGRISSAEAITIAYYRGYFAGKLLESNSNLKGAMIAVGLSQESADAELSHANLTGRLQVACVNSPENVTVSGDEDAVDALSNILTPRKVFNRKLTTGGMAYHSYHMLAIGEGYQKALENAFPLLGYSHRINRKVKFISSVAGAEKTEVDASYWRSNLERQTLFAHAMEYLLTKTGGRGFHLIELGPHSTMQLPIKQIRTHLQLDERKVLYSSALKRHEDGLARLLTLAGSLWLHGHEIPFDKVNGLVDASKSSGTYKVVQGMPNYPWHYRGLLWNESRPSKEFRTRHYARHELLGSLIPGGSGMDLVWRNVIRVEDVSWLQDHRLEDTAVFPAAGYLSMAMEAMLQAANMTWDQGPCFKIENVNIFAALALPENTSVTSSVELFTALSRKMLTYTADSASLWEFKVSSYRDGSPTPHARGTIMVQDTPLPIASRVKTTMGCALESASASTWYGRLKKGSLNYGSTFRPIETFHLPRARQTQLCQATVHLQQSLPADQEYYSMHPTSIDAMLQTCIVATTSGDAASLRAKVPTRIPLAIFNVPDVQKVVEETEPALCSAIARSTGFGTAIASAEFVSGSTDRICGILHDVRFAPYEISAQLEDKEEHRQPMCRVLWQPDMYGLGLLPALQISQALQQVRQKAFHLTDDEGLLQLCEVLNLITHKNPGLRVLQIGSEPANLMELPLSGLQAKGDFPRFGSFTVASILNDKELSGYHVDLSTWNPCEDAKVISTDDQFDLILLPSFAENYLTLEHGFPVSSYLVSEGLILGYTRTDMVIPTTLKGVKYPLHSGNGEIILAKPLASNSHEDEVLSLASTYIVVQESPSTLSAALVEYLHRTHDVSAQLIDFDDISVDSILPGSTIFSLVEWKSPMLANVGQEEMSRLQLLTKNASRLIWITGGNPLEGIRPEMALIDGLARTLMQEQPSLQFFTYHVAASLEAILPYTVANIVSVLHQKGVGPLDFEFCEYNGIPHVSRFVPDDNLNAQFRRKHGSQLEDITLEDCRSAGVRLSIERPGQFDTLYFQRMEDYSQSGPTVGPTDVQLQVQSIGLNAKDFYVLGGKVDTENATSCVEYAGIVEKVGCDVTRVQVGDRVVVMAPSHIQTRQVVPEWTCARLQEGEDENTLCTLPVAYATSLYALHHRAQIQIGESVLIHSAAGGVGLAAIQVAQRAGANIFASVSTEDKKDYLVERFQIPADQIFDSRDTSFLQHILAATNGRGVDVVLNSLTGDQLHASWKACAPFGRFIEIGRLDMTDSGKLEMEPFLKNVTFTAFDLSSLYHSDNLVLNRIWTSLLDQVLHLYRQGSISKIEPLEVFDVADMAHALRQFSSRTRMGRIAVSLANPSTRIRVLPSQHDARFYADRTYVLVGCLGGLGRSISRWMVTLGARKLIFLGRSGAKKPAAKAFVEDLKTQGATCTVLQGDVCNFADVERLICAVEGPIGGVVQAAMGVQASLFMEMTSDAWHAGIDPKVRGSWNLHRALQSRGSSDLDFFLMVSSISGSVGSATESNYCAANHFLDAFARYRRAQGLPATALGLGMITEVGYLHENPEVATMIARKGVQSIGEDELLQLIDISLVDAQRSQSQPRLFSSDTLSQAHILTGLELPALQNLWDSGFHSSNPIFNDPRAVLLTAAVSGHGTTQSSYNRGRKGSLLPTEVITALGAGVSLPDAVLSHITGRFGSLVLLAADQVDVTRSLSKYGMDSMLAAEFRTWIFQGFKVDIPFLTLLNKSCSIDLVSELVVAEVQPRMSPTSDVEKGE